MPMTINTEGMDELSRMLAQLGSKAQDVASGALYDGAGIVADAMKAAVNSIQAEPQRSEEHTSELQSRI